MKAIKSSANIRVLYIATDSALAGSTASLFNLLESLGDFINPIVLFREEGIGVDFFREKGIECYVYPFNNLFGKRDNRFLDVWHHPWRWHYIQKFKNDLACVKYVKKILNGRRIDIVHTNTSVTDIGVILSRSLHAKHVWHVREMPDLHWNAEIYLGLPRLRKLINHATGRIAISHFVKEHWQMIDHNSWVINDAVRSRSDVCYLPEKDNYVLFCSYFLTEPKGTRRAIIAFAKSGINKLNIRLKLIGNCVDEYKESLLETAREYNVQDDIDFVSLQQDVKPFFVKAKAYLMASENEGLGRVTAEAMFYGCPVVALASGGTLDIVKDKETGYLYNTSDECAELINHVCTTPQETIILRAQDFVIQNLSQEVYGPKIMELYNKMIRES